MSPSPASVVDVLARLWRQMTRRRRRQFFLLLFLTLAGAFAEVLTLGALLPFLAVLANPDLASGYPFVQSARSALGLPANGGVLLLLTLAFCLMALIAGAVRILLTWRSNSYIYSLGHEFSVKIYDNILHQDYSFHIGKNTSTTIAALQQAQTITTGVLLPTLQSISATIIGVFIVAALLIVDREISVVAFVGFGLLYLAISLVFRKRIQANSWVIARMQSERIQSVQEGLGGIRDVLINASQPVFLSRFRTLDANLQRSQAMNSLAGAIPRFAIESTGMILIAALACYLALRPGGLGFMLPMLGVLVLGAQRILPLMQLAYNGWTQILGNVGNADAVLAMLEAPRPNKEPLNLDQPLTFQREIALKDVSFRYASGEGPVLNGLNLVIGKGAKVGIVGETGSGKSTMTDLIMGLLEPTSGSIEIDGRRLDANTRRAWQVQIAHVPQTLFLADGSIAENIAFGVDPRNIDLAKVRHAAQQAALGRFIDGLPQGYDTPVGERGIRLSGGERQRVSIARALYRGAKVLVFDEATSALDVATERTVIESIRNLDAELTILVIAHRLTTVQYCDMIVTLGDQRSESIEVQGPVSAAVDGHSENTKLARSREVAKLAGRS